MAALGRHTGELGVEVQTLILNMNGKTIGMNTLSRILLVVVWLAACGPPSPQLTVAGKSTTRETVVPEEQIAFEVCGESTTWMRPTEQEQDVKWWSNIRYAGGDEEVVKYPWTHYFLVVYGSASLEYDITNLSGLWTLSGDTRAGCLEPTRRDAVLKLQTAEGWVLLHKVRNIKRTGTTYHVVVEPLETGVQFVQFARPEGQLPLTLHFVTEEGREIDRIVEATSPYWPYPELIPAPEP